MSGSLEHLSVDQAAVVRYLGLSASSPADQALVLVGQRYDLDPLLGQLCLIKGKLYVTEKGLWAVAHRSGQLDGVEVVAEGEDGPDYFARVTVWRKDMRLPFPGEGRFDKKTKGTGGKRMARKGAYMEALRMAFDVSLPALPANWETEEDAPVAEPTVAVVLPEEPTRRPEPAQHSPAPPPELPGEGKLRELSPAQRLAMAGKDAGLDDELRHRLVDYLTGGKSRSATRLDAEQAGRFRRICEAVKAKNGLVLENEISDQGLRDDLLKAAP